MNENLSWEDRYKELEAHHKEETKYLIQEINRLESSLTFEKLKQLPKIKK